MRKSLIGVVVLAVAVAVTGCEQTSWRDVQRDGWICHVDSRQELFWSPYGFAGSGHYVDAGADVTIDATSGSWDRITVGQKRWYLPAHYVCAYDGSPD